MTPIHTHHTAGIRYPRRERVVVVGGNGTSNIAILAIAALVVVFLIAR